MKYKKVLNDLKQLEDKEMDDYDRYEDLSDWVHRKANREDSIRGLYMLIEKQNKLIEKQGKRQIELLEQIEAKRW